MKAKRFAAFTAAFMILFSVFLSPLPAKGKRSYAAETNFENTNVLADLSETEGFDLQNYRYYQSDSPEIHVINVVEYCYSFYNNLRDHYGLYLYIYNPNALDIDTLNEGNKVQIAVKYDSDPITDKSAPTDYEKFDLKFCSMSSDADTFRLFYKFKVVDHISADGKYIVERVNSNARRYDISGIELVERGKDNATDFPLTGNYAVDGQRDSYGSFTFTGFAKGYGPDANAESTLSSSIRKLETVTLNVKHTFYRTKTSSKGRGHQNQIDTVYFTVPKRLFDEYGELQRIKAEWYEYKTKPILVTSNEEFYDFISQYIGVRTDSGSIPKNKFFDVNYSFIYDNAWISDHGWNNAGNPLDEGPLEDINPLYFIFPTKDWCDIKGYDPYADNIEAEGGVSSNALYEYIKRYNKTSENGYLPIKNRQISADLFEDEIDEERKIDNERGKVQEGYSFYDFDADLDLQEWQSWRDTDPSFWDNWSNFGFWETLFNLIPEETGRIMSPIQVITKKSPEINISDDSQLSDALYIHLSDVPTFRQECDEAFKVNGKDDEEKYVVLFRFAVTDYYFDDRTRLVEADDLYNEWFYTEKETLGQAYIAQQTCFFDFDIIQLSFLRNEDWIVIPAVSDPIDIINPITPPLKLSREEGRGILEILVAVILLILIIALVVIIVKKLFGKKKD